MKEVCIYVYSFSFFPSSMANLLVPSRIIRDALWLQQCNCIHSNIDIAPMHDQVLSKMTYLNQDLITTLSRQYFHNFGSIPVHFYLPISEKNVYLLGKLLIRIHQPLSKYGKSLCKYKSTLQNQNQPRIDVGKF